MKKLLCLLLSLCIIYTPLPVLATERAEIYPYDTVFSDFWFAPAAAEYSGGEAKAQLLMEYSTGKVLFAQNEHEQLPIASVTKVISILLVLEAIDDGRIRLDDLVTVSEHAASMGGSQIFLEAGEEMTVSDLLKSVIVASANDATAALGEYICGSEEAFIAAMNARASELGCENSNFVNTNGLPQEGHYSCAYDIALITRELMNHKMVFDYTKIWTDTVRNGTFGLANTNKLIRFYKGATGMKTGFTAEAKFCLSGTAERDGMHLIAVVLGAETSEKRFSAAKSMLDYGFANYTVVTPDLPELADIKISRGVKEYIPLTAEGAIEILTEKGAKGDIESQIVTEEWISAPFDAGTEAGYIAFSRGGQEIGRVKIVTVEGCEEISYFPLLKKVFSALLGKALQ